MSKQVPTSTNLPHVVHAFLSDRRCEKFGVLQALGPLYSAPDFTSVVENHLRTSALFACKKVHRAKLGLFLRPYHRVGGGLVFDSTFNWCEGTLSRDKLESSTALNIWRQPIWHSVSEVVAGRQISCSTTARVIAGIQSDALRTPRQLPPLHTIWRRLPGNALMCVEGNYRFHTLAIDVQAGRAQHEPSYPVWIGVPRTDLSKKWPHAVPIAGDEWLLV
jgi:hypothetical protein